MLKINSVRIRLDGENFKSIFTFHQRNKKILNWGSVLEWPVTLEKVYQTLVIKGLEP